MVVGARIPSPSCPSSLLPPCAEQRQSSAKPRSFPTFEWSPSQRLAQKGGWLSRERMSSPLSTVRYLGDAGRAIVPCNGRLYNSGAFRRPILNCECVRGEQSEGSPIASSSVPSLRIPSSRRIKLDQDLQSETVLDVPLDERPEKSFSHLSLAPLGDIGLAPILAGAILILSCGLFSPKAALAERRRQTPVSATVGVALSPREQSAGAQIQDGEKRDPEPFPQIAKFHLGKKLDDPQDDQTALSLKRYLESNPGDRNALKSLLHLRMTKGEVNSSIEVLDQLVAAEPDVIEWKYIRAQALEFSGDLDAAREGFERILEQDPFSARALQGLATVMQKTGEDSLVLEMLEGAVQKAVGAEKKKEATNLKMLLGQIHMTQGNMDEALKQYKEISDDDPKDFRPHLCQGLVYSIIGQLDEADSHFKQFRALCPPNFPNRGYLDDMMLRAKTEARRLEDKKKQDATARLRGRKARKPLQQPKAGGPPPENDD